MRTAVRGWSQLLLTIHFVARFRHSTGTVAGKHYLALVALRIEVQYIVAASIA